MSFLTIAFLWAGLSVAIPIAIALWNRRRYRREKFGAYFLLKKVAETTQRRIQLLQILKLINRVALFVFVVALVAEPVVMQQKLGSAEDGFAIMLDVGRSLQSRTAQNENLSALQMARLKDYLGQMPEGVQGAVFFVSRTCQSARTTASRMTANPKEWLEHFETQSIAYRNVRTTVEGIHQCMGRLNTLFSGVSIFKVFISPLPDSIEEKGLRSLEDELEIDVLPPPVEFERDPLEVKQVVSRDRVRLMMSPRAKRQASLIRTDKVEALGTVEEALDLMTSEKLWVWLRKPVSSDPWANHKIFSVESLTARQVTLWSMKETEGYLSLLAALRSHPHLKVIRQVGGQPVGDPIIIYGSYPYSQEILGRAWFFVSPEGQMPFEVRDQKKWTPGLESEDLRRAFRFKTRDGDIFIRKYALFDLDRFTPIESFEDGAPSLMESQFVEAKHWISPFDLEDLTTDLTLEPTFIPYLYRRLERWLSATREQEGEQAADWKPLWLMPSHMKPTAEVVREHDWPGIYQSGESFRVVQPTAPSNSYLSWQAKTGAPQLVDEEVSLRAQVIRAITICVFLELLFCLLSAKFGILALLLAMSLVPSAFGQSTNRQIAIGMMKGSDTDRRESLSQLVKQVSTLSNLDFRLPKETGVEQMPRHALIVVSSDQKFGPYSKGDREKIRDYMERGGLFVFDDPLAMTDTAFYRSVQKELSQILPGRPLKSVPKDNVLFRTYYLLNEVAGRRLAAPRLEGVELDGRWVAVFSFNDLLGANLRSANGDFAFSVTPYGITQRILSKRLLLNLLMYSVTTDYKDDAIHLPFILRKRVR